MEEEVQVAVFEDVDKGKTGSDCADSRDSFSEL